MGRRAGAGRRIKTVTQGMQASGTQIRLDGCGKTFADGTRALQATSLQVEPGEILALLGPSGCGKTTMLRIIAGLENADAGGRVFFDNDDVTRVPIEKRSVGMVFQSYALFPNMSVRQNIAYGLKVKGVVASETNERVERLMQFCQLTRFAERNIAQLSGGQRQRVALARAVAPQPRVLLLDEPLSALDAALRDQLRNELAALLRQFSITAIFVTHDQAEAMAIADRVCVMSHGKVLQIDTAEAVYRNPKTGFVATFVGGANRLGGRIEADRLHLPGGPLSLAGPASADVEAFARPERVRLAKPSDQITLKASLASVLFQGTHYLGTATGATDAPILFHITDQPPPRPGETIALAIDARDIMLLPRDVQESA